MASNQDKPAADPRKSGPHFDLSIKPDSSMVYAPDVEVAPPTGHVVENMTLEPDEDACSLLVLDYPKDGDLGPVQDRFLDIASLRRDVERDNATGNILVVFGTQADMKSAWDWFRDAKAYINRIDCRLQLVKKGDEPMST